MAKRPGSTYIRQLLEGVVTVALVLLFFFIIMSVLNLLFPSGGFSLFMKRDEVAQVNSRLKREHDLRLARNGQSEGLDTGREWAARITTTRNDVKSKRAAEIAWHPAESGMRLNNLDAVQTLDDSTAVIHFDDRNEIDLGENSLIVIRRMEQDLIFKEKRSYMVVVDGELRGRIGGQQDDGVYLEVATPNAITRLQNRTQSEDPLEFRINVEDENSSTITLYSGEAEVEARGETVQLRPDQVTRVIGAAAPSIPVTLPPSVRPSAPADGSRFAYRNLPPQVEFAWRPLAAPTAYRLQIARDRQFRDMAFDETLAQAGFTHGNLPHGDYYWRVNAIRNGVEGAYSTVRRLRMEEDRQPPVLEVAFPDGPVQSTAVALHGRSEPGSKVFVAGQQIKVAADGAFHTLLPVERGLNVVVVEAFDAAGNVSFSSEMIHAIY